MLKVRSVTFTFSKAWKEGVDKKNKLKKKLVLGVCLILKGERLNCRSLIQRGGGGAS